MYRCVEVGYCCRLQWVHGLESEPQVLVCILDVVYLHVISCFLLLNGLVNGELSSFIIWRWVRVGHVPVIVLWVYRCGVAHSGFLVSIRLFLCVSKWPIGFSNDLRSLSCTFGYTFLFMFAWYNRLYVWRRCIANKKKEICKWDGFGAYLRVSVAGWGHVNVVLLELVWMHLNDPRNYPSTGQRVLRGCAVVVKFLCLVCGLTIWTFILQSNCVSYCGRVNCG